MEKKKEETAIATYDEQLAAAAEAAAKMAVAAGGSFFSIRGGRLTFDGNPIPNNEMAVVVVDGILENCFYPGAFDPDNPSGPECYAFGRDEKTMAPHKEVVGPVASACVGCPNNEFGSSEKGRGKACKNRRRLALLSAGVFSRDGTFEPIPAEDLVAGDVAYFNVPPTSIRRYDGYVRSIAAAPMKRPPFAVYTRIKVSPDSKTQVKVEFEPLGKVPDGAIQKLIERNKTESELIVFPYAKPEGVASQKPAKKKSIKKKTTKKAGRSY